MVLTMTRPWKHPKTQVYYFRKGVPAGMRPILGKSVVKVSLGTKDPSEAKRLHLEIAAQVEAEWTQLRRTIEQSANGSHLLTLTQEEIVGLSGELYRRLMVEHGSEPGRTSMWLERLQRAQSALPQHKRAPDAGRSWDGWAFAPSQMAMRLVGGEVNELLVEKGLSVDWESRSRLNVAGATAVAQAYRELAKRAGGDYRPDPDAERFPEFKPRSAAKSTQWQAVYALYRADLKPSPATVKRQSGVLSAFFAHLGHDDLSTVGKDDAEAWVEHRLLAVSSRTVRDADLAHPKALFNWARRKGHIAHRPFEDIKINVSDGPKLREREFELEEAEAILLATLTPAGPRMTVEGAAALRWVPWICCYTGARVNEITQARHQDVRQRKSRNGQRIWCIRITPEAGTVKDQEARWVALHPHIIEQGFLDYVASRSERPLFYDPSRARDGTPANPQYKKVGERLAAWVRHTVGIKDTGVDPNHGWRHLFRSSLLAAEVQEQVIDRIDGHKGKTVGQSYGTAWPEVMLAAVSKIPAYRLDGAI
jgi:integrase